MRVYIDTSVIGGYYDKEFKEWSQLLIQEIHDGKKTAVISDITFKEIENAPDKVREILFRIPEKYMQRIILSAEARNLAKLYMDEKIITKKYLLDAQHIAIATIERVDVILSWNFKHIVNFSKIRLYNSVNLKYGYSLIEIRTPREVINA